MWIEKDALVGVIEGVCNEYRVPHFSCRGYPSQSEVWNASQRLATQVRDGKDVTILHLGDHDPSGIDMTRDILDRTRLFVGRPINVKRIALNYEQIEAYAPPPNPTKMTDTRARDYVADFGRTCWELDALEPRVISGLIEDFVRNEIDWDAWEESLELEYQDQKKLKDIADEWNNE